MNAGAKGFPLRKVALKQGVQQMAEPLMSGFCEMKRFWYDLLPNLKGSLRKSIVLRSLVFDQGTREGRALLRKNTSMNQIFPSARAVLFVCIL